MAQLNPSITSWHGYKTSASTAEIVLIGRDFGSLIGIVKILVQGGGSQQATVRYWSNDAIVIDAPVDAVVQRAFVDIPSSGRGPRVRAHTPPTQVWTTATTAPAAAVTDVETDDTLITITGTDLDTVDEVVLLQNESGIGDAEQGQFVANGSTELLVAWPVRFPSNVGRIRLVDSDGQTVLEISQPGGFQPVPDPTVTSVQVSRLPSGQQILTIYGFGFGAVQGRLRLRVQSPWSFYWITEAVLSGGWTDTLIYADAPEGTTITQMELITDAGETVLIAPGVLPIVTQSGSPRITSVYQPSNGRLRVVGTDLLEAAFVGFGGTWGGNAVNPDVLGDFATLLNSSPSANCVISEWSNTAIEFSHNELLPDGRLLQIVNVADEYQQTLFSVSPNTYTI